MRPVVPVMVGLLALAVSDCRANDEERNVLMVANISTQLSVNDTLVVIREIQNRGPNTVWFDVSSALPGFEAWNATDQVVCRPGVSSLELALIGVTPGTAVVDERRFPVASLQSCTPGTYSIRVTANVHSRSDASDRGTVLRSTITDLVITQ